MKKTLLNIFLIIFCFISLNAQEDIKQEQDSLNQIAIKSLLRNTEESFIPQILPPSPQSAIYKKYLDHKINEYTGIPNISIPLFEMEIKGMKIPIILSYHASGVKAHQYDGDVGAGWSINVGGFKVMRTIYGKADEYIVRHNYSSWAQNYANIDESSTTQQRLNKDLYLIRFAGGPSVGTLDGEYDNFSYILPSSTGNFIIQNGTNQSQIKAIIAEGQRDKIAFTDWNQSFTNIQITDEQGFVYQMGANNVQESSRDHFRIVGWPLVKITTPNNEIVQFEYNNYETMYNYSVQTQLNYTEAPFYTNRIPNVNDPDGGTGYFEGENMASADFPSGHVPTNSQLVSKITTPNCKIVFIRRGPQSSNPSESVRYLWNQLITGIEIYDNNNQLVKKINFDYDFVTATSNNRHNLLKSVVINGGQTNPQEKYQFSYYPSSSTITNDWGYGGNSKYFHELFKNFSLLWKKTITGMDEYYQLRYILPTSDINFANLSNNNYPTSEEYSLKRITYPTGGFTEYQYEPHQDSNGMKIGGLRIKRITSKAAESALPTISEFQYENGSFEVQLTPEDFGEETYTLNFFNDNYAFLPGHPSTTYRGSRTLRFSTSPIQGELLNCKAIYGKVTTLHYGQNQSEYNGKTVSNFININRFEKAYIPQRARITPFSADNSYNLNMPSNGLNFGRGFWRDAYIGYEPVLQSRSYYDKDNNLKKVEGYAYQEVRKGTMQELRVKQKIHVNNNSYNVPEVDVYKFISSCFDYLEYDIKLGFYRLSSKATTDYTNNGTVTINEVFNYNNNNQLIEKTTDTYSEQYKYTEDFTESVYTNMVNANILSPVVEKISYNALNGTRSEIGRTKTNYIKRNNIYLPSSIQTKMPNESYRNEILFDSNDIKGNIQQYTRLDGTKVTYLWSYSYQYPIAEIINASYSEVSAALSALGITVASLATNSNPNETTINKVRQLKTSLPNALVSVYTYKPLIGILTITDPSGIITYYEYDNLGRLKRVYIKENNAEKVIESYDYNLKNQ